MTASVATMRDLVSLTKPRVTALVLATAAGGMALAPPSCDTAVSLGVLVAIALIVGSANALNCGMERESDGRMARTRDRALPAGRLDPRIALGFGIGLAMVSLPVLALGANVLTAVLGALALVSYVGVYTPLKRVSPTALLVGAIPGALPPLMGWTAASGHIEIPGVALFVVLFVWQVPHFLAIAVLRQEEYAAAGLRTFAVVHGSLLARRRAVAYSGALLAVTLALVPLGIGGPLYLGTALLTGAAYVALAVSGLRATEPRLWARRAFAASIAHLTLLVLALALERV
jgi:protoheme IX farnesyltransferase